MNAGFWLDGSQTPCLSQLRSSGAVHVFRREFLKRCLAPKARESNPECVVLHRVRSDDAPPVIAVEFGEWQKNLLTRTLVLFPVNEDPSIYSFCLAVNGFKDQFNCHKFTVNDIIERIRSVSNEMETKSLLAEAGLKTTDIHLTGHISGAKNKSQKKMPNFRES